MKGNVRNLATELLHSIFLYAAQMHWEERSEVHTEASACWAISQTCARWRSIALSARQLWADIILNLSSDQFVEAYPVHKIFIHLNRSKNAGLRIRIRVPASDSQKGKSQTIIASRYVLELLDILSRHSTRWRSFELDVTDSSFHNARYWRTNGHLAPYATLQKEILHERLFIGSFPVLESLKIECGANKGKKPRKKCRGMQVENVLKVDIDALELKEVSIESGACCEVNIRQNKARNVGGGAVGGGGGGR